MIEQQLALFDYGQLDAETRIVVQQRTSEIKALMKRTAQDIIEIGQKLIEVKERLGYRAYGDWLKAEFGWTERTAQRFVNVSEKFENYDNLSVFAPSALYLLAAPSTPDEARHEAIDRAQNGETITHAAAKEIVNGHKPAPQTAPAYTPPATPGSTRRGAPLEPETFDSTAPWAIAPEPETQPEQEPQTYNYKRDNRRSQPADIYTPQGMDACQTPAYAIDPLLPYLPREWVIWEPACGEGLLIEALYDSGFGESRVVFGDILTGQNFFDHEPKDWDCLVTNPPYSLKYKWLKRCYELGKPFALLLPVETVAADGGAALFDEFGVEIIWVRPRINFKMPFAGWESTAQFPTAWFTWGLNIGKQMTFAKVTG